MKVTTNIGRSDLIKFNAYVIPRMKSTYVTGLIASSFVFAFVVWKYGVPCNSFEWGRALFVSLGGGIGAIISGSLFSLVGILFVSSNTNGVLGKHHYELTDIGLLERTEANEGISKWQGIDEIREIGGYLLFRISGDL